MGNADTLFDLAASISIDDSKSDKVLAETERKANSLNASLKELDKTASSTFTNSTQSLQREFGISASIIQRQTKEAISGGINPLQKQIDQLAQTAPAGFAKVRLGVTEMAAALNKKELLGSMSRQLLDTERNAERAANSLTKQLGGALSDLAPKARMVFGDAGSMGSAALKMGAVTGSAVGMGLALAANIVIVEKLHEELFKFVTDSAQFDANLVNLSNRYGRSIQTIVAAQLVAAQTGRTLTDVLKDNSEETEKHIALARRYGIEVGSVEVAAGKRLNNELVALGFQWEALEVKIGRAITPATVTLVDSLSTSLKENKDTVNDLVLGVGLLATYLGSMLKGSIDVVNVSLATMQANLAPLINTIQFIKGLGGLTGDIPVQSTSTTDLTGVDRSIAGAGIFRQKKVDGGGGGGQSRGHVGVDPAVAEEQRRLDYYNSLVDELNKLEAQLDGVDISTRAYAVDQSILNGALKDADAGLKKLAIETAKRADNAEKHLALQKRLNTFLVDQTEEVRKAVEGERSYLDVANELIASLEKEGAVLQARTKDFMRSNAMTLQYTKDVEHLAEVLNNLPDMPSLMTISGVDEDAIARAAGAAADVAAGAAPENIYQQILDARRRMQELAADLTNLISDSLHEGFSRGIKAGLVTFAEGILQMIESAALRALEQRLFDVFSKALGGGKSGGGIAATIGSLIAGAAGGGAFAEGGYMKPNTWNLVGERGPELIRSGSQGATVLPNHAITGQGHTFIVNISVPDIQSAGSRATQYQVARAMQSHLAKAALTG